MINHKKQSGFTLIELLVVIAIIGILASTVLASLQDSRALARDSVRVSDMKQIRNALELFYFEHNRYPGTVDGIPDPPVGGNQMIGVGHPIDTVLAPYMTSVPKDPLHDGVSYFYSYDPVHIINFCSPGPIILNPVFGFNRAESITGLSKDTCGGGHSNLNNADYNFAPTEH